jgi:senataxin
MPLCPYACIPVYLYLCITRYGCRRLVLVGDPRQLPATILSPSAEAAGLGMSLFERLERAHHEVVMLTIQYRMAPEIRAFPSKHFYQGKLIDAETIQAQLDFEKAITHRPTIGSVMAQLGLNPMNFFDIPQGHGHFSDEKVGTSFRNEAQCRFIVSLLAQVMVAVSKLSPSLSVAVITPYKAQVRRLKELIRQHDADFSSPFTSEGCDARMEDIVEVNSVDGFQGREKDVVIFSSVKTRGSISFLSDERRLNVAITRAKRCLVLVGRASALQSDPMWRALIQDSQAGSGNFHTVAKVDEHGFPSF